MSSTTLYAIDRGGDIAQVANYRNSHGSAPAIWSILTARYVPDGMPMGGTIDQRMDWRMAGRKEWLMDSEHCFKHMGEMSREGRMCDSDALAFATTLDMVSVRIDDVPRVAESLELFAAEHGKDHGEMVFHIPAQAACLREVYANRERMGWRGVCWNQTSLADTFEAAGMCDEDGDRDPYNFLRQEDHEWIDVAEFTR